MEPYRDDEFVATLESLRPEPSREFATELDRRAAAGFPRRSRGGMETGWRRLIDWLRQARPGKLALAGGGVALIAVALATAVIAGSEGESSSLSRTGSTIGRESSESAGTLGDLNKFDGSLGAEAGEGASPESAGESASGEGGELKSGPASDSASSNTGAKPLSEPNHPTGPYAAGARHRDVERAAEMTLGTDPSRVGDASGKVLETVHAYNGIVLNSSVHGGSEGEPSADFELLIPSSRLSDALAAFSAIAEVRARHESSDDITAPTVTTAEMLQDSHARIESLLNQLADAETEAEQEAAEAKLRAERRHAANLKSQLTSLQRRANLSRVSLQIVSDETSASSGGAWDAGDALHDAGHVLSVAAGVTILALAVLAPIALLVLLAWLAHRAWLRSRRDRALG